MGEEVGSKPGRVPSSKAPPSRPGVARVGQQGSLATQLQVATSFDTLLHDFEQSFVITNPRLPDNPLCYASPSFFELTGYSPSEILGRNCRLLQGPNTCRRSVLEIRDAIREEMPATACLLNYRRDGSAFWNCIALHPVRAAGGNGPVTLYVGLQTDVSRLVESQAGAARSPRGATVRSPELDASARRASLGAEAVAAALAVAAHAHSLPPCASLAAAGSVPSALLCALGAIRESFVLTDPWVPGGPIVYASPGFLALTGHCAASVLGRNPRLLQGPETSPAALATLREALHANPPRPVTLTLANRRAGGGVWWNCLHIAPLRDATGQVRYLVGTQTDVTDARRGQDDTLHPPDPVGGGHSRHAAGDCDGTRPPLQPDAWHALKARGVAGQVRIAARALGPSGLVRQVAS